MRLHDLQAVITGGGTGMGAAAAQELASAGANCALFGRRADVLRNTAGPIGARAVPCDISDPQAVSAAFESLANDAFVARVLVHAAALGSMVPLLDASGTPTDVARLQEIIATNVLGALYVNQAFAAHLARAAHDGDGPRGVIVNVSSIGASDGVVGSAYAASKSAVDGLCLSLARELSRWKIRVVTVAPGSVDTPMLRAGANEATYELVRNTVPSLGRLGAPAEFAALVRHICENDYLNACSIRFDGGMRIPFVLNVGKESEALLSDTPDL